MKKIEFYTIGVYGSTEESFFQKLVENQIDTFCDIRQRRGVRGAKYAYVNSNRLQTKLAELDIKYGYVSDLAPAKEIRELQKLADAQSGVLKRERTELGSVFKAEYNKQVLTTFDFDRFIDQLEEIGAQKVVLFCVEEYPSACHRSLVDEKFKEITQKTIIDL